MQARTPSYEELLTFWRKIEGTTDDRAGIPTVITKIGSTDSFVIAVAENIQETESKALITTPSSFSGDSSFSVDNCATPASTDDLSTACASDDDITAKANTLQHARHTDANDGEDVQSHTSGDQEKAINEIGATDGLQDIEKKVQEVSQELTLSKATLPLPALKTKCSPRTEKKVTIVECLDLKERRNEIGKHSEDDDDEQEDGEKASDVLASPLENDTDDDNEEVGEIKQSASGCGQPESGIHDTAEADLACATEGSNYYDTGCSVSAAMDNAIARMEMLSASAAQKKQKLSKWQKAKRFLRKVLHIKSKNEAAPVAAEVHKAEESAAENLTAPGTPNQIQAAQPASPVQESPTSGCWYKKRIPISPTALKGIRDQILVQA